MRTVRWLTLIAAGLALALAVGTAVAQDPSNPYYYAPLVPPAPDADYDPSETAILSRLPDPPAAVPGVAEEPPMPLTIEQQLAELQRQVDELKNPKPTPPAPAKFPNLTVNGVFQADAVLFNQDAANLATFGPIENGADFRRARLSAKGSVNPTTNYFFQMDFAFFGRPTFTDVWVEWTDIPVLGNVRAGQWKQPFSLEVVSSFRYTTFMERSLLFQPFTPFRHIAIGFYDHSEDLNTTWAASFMRTGQDQYGGSISTDGGNGFAGRITHLPYYDECSDGRAYWHIGGAYYLNSPPRDTVRFRTIPEIFVGENGAGPVGTSGQAVPGALNGTPFFVDTLPITGVNAVHTFGLESLTVLGPFSLQAEAMAAVVDQQANPTAVLGGFYAQAGYFLTGEHRPYDRAAGAIDRVKPFEDFFWVNTEGGRYFGTGAWEVAARISYLDLTDANINGGQITDITGGVNWYMNAYTKAVFNYVHSWTDYRSTGFSEANAFGFRVQVDF
jgi:phosphate-selective porin OprO/OprP